MEDFGRDVERGAVADPGDMRLVVAHVHAHTKIGYLQMRQSGHVTFRHCFHAQLRQMKLQVNPGINILAGSMIKTQPDTQSPWPSSVVQNLLERLLSASLQNLIPRPEWGLCPS